MYLLTEPVGASQVTVTASLLDLYTIISLFDGDVITGLVDAAFAVGNGVIGEKAKIIAVTTDKATIFKLLFKKIISFKVPDAIIFYAALRPLASGSFL